MSSHFLIVMTSLDWSVEEALEYASQFDLEASENRDSTVILETQFIDSHQTMFIRPSNYQDFSNFSTIINNRRKTVFFCRLRLNFVDDQNERNGQQNNEIITATGASFSEPKAKANAATRMIELIKSRFNPFQVRNNGKVYSLTLLRFVQWPKRLVAQVKKE